MKTRKNRLNYLQNKTLCQFHLQIQEKKQTQFKPNFILGSTQDTSIPAKNRHVQKWLKQIMQNNLSRSTGEPNPEGPDHSMLSEAKW